MPKAPIFPPVAAWKTLLDDNVEAPLAADSRRVFVATRDGVVRALDATTGSPLWKVEGYPGRLSAGDGVLFVRDEKGTVTSLHPRNGEVRWRTETGVAGTLPVLVDRDRVHVAGRGLASLLLETGAPVFVDAAGPETTAPPVAATSSILTGEADGTLRCRDRATGSWMSEPRFFRNGISRRKARARKVSGAFSASGVPIATIPSTSRVCASRNAKRPPIETPTTNTCSCSARSASNSRVASATQST